LQKELRFKQSSVCTRTFDGPISLKTMISISFVVWYIVPLFTIAYLYFRIGLVLWKSSLKPLEVRYSNGTSLLIMDQRPQRLLADSCGTATLTINYETEQLNGNGTATQTRQSTDEHTQTPTANGVVTVDVIESRKKIIRLLIAIVSSFALLTFPHNARMLHGAWSSHSVCNNNRSILLQPFSFLCLFISSSLNPILYAFMSQRFRSATRDVILHCR
jgi:hypothetical protein